MKFPYKSLNNDDTDFFALWEKEVSKSKVKLVNQNSIKVHKNIRDKKDIHYTKEDEMRRAQITKTKEELYLLATNQNRDINKITKEMYNKKREEFINIKKVLQAQMNTSIYTKAV